MNWRTTICITILSLAFSSLLTGQTDDELVLLKDHSHFEDHRHEGEYEFIKKEGNEVLGLASGLFLLYKKFISSQDAVSCVFHPSCSEYAIQAIQKQGLILGGMNAFDRLTRCNALSPEQYPLYPGTNLFYDPVEASDDEK